MHPSRMRAIRLLSLSRSIQSWGSAYRWGPTYRVGVPAPWHFRKVVMSHGQTGACENITFPQLCLWAVINSLC